MRHECGHHGAGQCAADAGGSLSRLTYPAVGGGGGRAGQEQGARGALDMLGHPAAAWCGAVEGQAGP